MLASLWCASTTPIWPVPMSTAAMLSPAVLTSRNVTPARPASRVGRAPPPQPAPKTRTNVPTAASSVLASRDIQAPAEGGWERYPGRLSGSPDCPGGVRHPGLGHQPSVGFEMHEVGRVQGDGCPLARHRAAPLPAPARPRWASLGEE